MNKQVQDDLVSVIVNLVFPAAIAVGSGHLFHNWGAGLIAFVVSFIVIARIT